MKIKPLLGVLALAAASGSALAAGPLKGLIGLNGGSGGDTLASVSMTDGTKQDIKAGGGVQFYAGFEYQSEGSPLAIQVNLGYHTDSTNASNGKISFSRVPFEALAFYSLADNFRLGGGFRKSSSAKLDSSGAAAGFGNYSFDGKPGFVVQGEWLMSANASLLLRHVSEKYDFLGTNIKGDHFGLGLSFRF